mgnify:CR=1 FL=1
MQTEPISKPVDDVELFHRVRSFLTREAELIDARKFDDWKELMTEDLEYKIPVRATRGENTHEDDFLDMHHVEDTKYRLEKRINRLNTEYSWSEQPPSRTRHLISNVQVGNREAEDEYAVKSNLLLYVSEGDDPDHKLLSGRRHDVIREVNGSLKLARRIIHLDNTTLPLDRISVFI